MSALPSHLPTTAPPPPFGGATPTTAPPLGDLGASALAVRIRDLGPADAHLLDALHEGLSSKSRYQRYHAAKPRLGSRERAFLAGADGRDHVALVALEPGGAPIGVARYVRERGEPRTADVAAEVVDRFQRHGLGSELLGRLARRAAAAGVERFTATVLSQTGLRRALTRRGWRVRSFDGPTTTLEADVWALLKA